MGSSFCKPKRTKKISDVNDTDHDKVSFDNVIASMHSYSPHMPPQSDLDTMGTEKSLLKHAGDDSICSQIPIIHPFGPFRFIWDSFVIAALLYTSIAVPYTLTFGVMLKLTDCSGIIALLIDLFLLMDIAINFRTAYVDKYDHLHLVTAPKYIARQYLKSWFWLDLISSFPFEFVIPLIFTNNSDDKIEFIKVFRVFRLLRGLKMLRVLRIFKVFRGFHRYAYVREAAMVLKCVRCLVAMLITAHYFACFWYLVGYHTQANGKESWLQIIEAHHDNPSNFTKYSYSWYWAIVTLFTTGYGDIHAYNEEEQWTASICILIGTCFFAYFIGVLTSLLEEGDRVRMYELERVEEAQLFCAHHRIPRQLGRAIVTHIRYHCNYNYLFDHQRIMESIPPYLQNHVTQHLAQSLSDLDMFKHLPLSVIGQIALKMTSTSCNSGHTLFTKGELSHEFYIQRTGRSVLHRNTSLKAGKTRILERGDVCGEYAILSGRHRDTVKCLTWSEFYVLDINDLLSVLRNNFIDSKTFHRAYRNIKTVLRKTLQKATKRKVKFSNNNEENEYIPQLSPDATRSIINYAYCDHSGNEKNSNTSYQKLNIPKSTEPTAVDKVHYQQLKKRSSSGKLIQKLSGILRRENSAGRHELAIKKPNALAMDVAKLDTAHCEFEYSDHEDSHFFSDLNHSHDITNTHHRKGRSDGTKTDTQRRKGRRTSNKFGGKKRYRDRPRNSTNMKSFGATLGHQISEMFHGLKTDNDSSVVSRINSEDSMDSDENDGVYEVTVPSLPFHIIEMGQTKSITRNNSGNITPIHELEIIRSNQEFATDLEKLEEIDRNEVIIKDLPEITPRHRETLNSNRSEKENEIFLYSTKEIHALSLDSNDIEHTNT